MAKSHLKLVAELMWLIFQSLIVFAVGASNIRWHWTESRYLASVLGFLLALLVTVGLSRLIDSAHGTQKRPLRVVCIRARCVPASQNESTARAESLGCI
jgi:hypothetical protein